MGTGHDLRRLVLGVEEPVDVCREIKVVLKQKAMAGVAIDFNGCVRNKRAEQIGKAWWDHQICVAVSREGRLLYRSKTEELAVIGNAPVNHRVILCVAGLDGAQHVALIFALQKPVEELHALRLAIFGVLEEDVEQLRAADVGLTRGVSNILAPALHLRTSPWSGAGKNELTYLRRSQQRRVLGDEAAKREPEQVNCFETDRVDEGDGVMSSSGSPCLGSVRQTG